MQTLGRMRSTNRTGGGRNGELELELGGVLAPPLAARHGVTRAELRAPLRAVARLVPELLSAAAPSGFLKLPRRAAPVRAVQRSAARWRRRRLRDWIHIGIGGSSLGAETLLGALGHPFRSAAGSPRVHFVDNVDPERLRALLESVDLGHAGVHVVSKSGGTVETAAAYQLVRDALDRKAGASRWQDRCVFTTGRSGALAAIARRERVEVLPFPEDVGGRFSVLSPSGLLTPAVAGVDVAGVVAGARRQLARWVRSSAGENPALVSAAVLHALAEKGKSIHVLMPYSDALEPLAHWYVQLSGESLGKRNPAGGRRPGVGVTPLPARGTSDQHSQVQLFVEGPADKLVTFVALEKSPRLRVPGGEPAPYLEGVELGELLRAEQRGTEVALSEAGRPTSRWTLPELAPGPLGALFLALELQVAAQATMLGIDAYDQPGVEAGKVAAFALLGREGYEAERARIEANAPPSWVIRS
jgi:glucose-6-phosphate isomerase